MIDTIITINRLFRGRRYKGLRRMLKQAMNAPDPEAVIRTLMRSPRNTDQDMLAMAVVIAIARGDLA